MKKLCTLFVLAFSLFACSGDPSFDDVGDGGNSGDEFGVVEQELSVNSSKYGITTASTHQTCRSDGPSGQDCLVPSSKTIQYCYSNAGGAWTAADVASLELGVGQIAGDFPGFSFGRVTAATLSIEQANCANNGTAVKFRKGTCSGGSTGSNIENFACFTPTISGGALTETLPGTWRKMLGGTVTIDLADLTAIGDDTFQDCRKRGVSHWLAAAAGFGNDSSVSNTALHTSRSIVGCPLATSASGQEQCFALSVDLGGGGGGGFMAFNSAVCNP